MQCIQKEGREGRLLKGAKLEALVHCESFEALLIPQVVFQHAALDELHGEAARVDGRVGIQSWHHLHNCP